MTKEELFAVSFSAPPEYIYRKVKENWNQVAKPLNGLGKLEEMICRIGAIQKTQEPQVSPRRLVIFCADNGIVEEGVSQSGQEVTLAVARNMGAHKSSVCKMAEISGTEVIAVDIGVNSRETIPGVLSRKVCPGTRNFLKEPAMTQEQTLQAITCGISMVRECKEQGYRILATGEMGIGNTTTSTAVTAALLGLDPREITGRGAGLSTEGLSRKMQVILEGIKKYADSGEDDQEKAFRILTCLGGLDIAGLCGVFLGGAMYEIPVVIDGVISAAAALCACRIAPGAEAFMLASHEGAEPAIQRILHELHLSGIIHADLALGEGTGAVMVLSLLEMALAVYRDSNSFSQIGMRPYQKLS